jgi:hypothetical protein
MTQATNSTTHIDREGEQHELVPALLPDLQPGEMRTTLPDRWCEKCQQLRPRRTCAICGQQTTAPPADVLDELAAARAQLDERLRAAAGRAAQSVPVHVVELDAAGNHAGGVPGDPDDDLDDDDDTDDADDDEAADDELDGLTLEVPDVAQDADLTAGGKGLGLLGRLAAAQRTRATASHVAVEDLTRREFLIASRPKGPIARGIEERSRPRAWQPLTDRTTRRNQPMTARPMSSRNRDLDERGREVQRTEGRAKTRSVEDQLVGLWEQAKMDITSWNLYYAAAMQQVQYDDAGKPCATTPEDGADMADQMYLQRLLREKYATA